MTESRDHQQLQTLSLTYFYITSLVVVQVSVIFKFYNLNNWERGLISGLTECERCTRRAVGGRGGVRGHRGFCLLPVFKCTTVAGACWLMLRLTNWESVWVWSLPYVSHTHLHSVPRLNSALTVDRGGGLHEWQSIKTPCLEQKEPVVAVAYSSLKASFLFAGAHSPFSHLIHCLFADSLKTIALFYALTRMEQKKG